jgi:L-fuculose-phosphate aldolase
MSLKTELIYYSKLCYKSGFIKSTAGNLSVKSKKNLILITPSNKRKNSLKTKDIVKTDLNGKKLSGAFNPSSELKLHLFIYKHRSDVNAVIHTHPVFITSFAAAGVSLDKIILPEMYLTFGKIPLANYAPPSTNELASSLKKFVLTYNAVILANHGLVTYGKSLEEAYILTEKAEEFAEIYFYSSLLGKQKSLTKNHIKILKELKK